MQETTDEKLIREFVDSGSRLAYGELYNRYKDKVFNTAYRIVGNWEGARDVAHDVFLKIHREAAGFRFKASFSSWIYRIAVNRSLDEVRRARRRRTQSLSDSVRNRLASTDKHYNPHASAVERETEEIVAESLEKLSPKLRTVITLRYFEMLSYKEIAEIIERPLGTVKSRLRRGHRTLGRLLRGRKFPG